MRQQSETEARAAQVAAPRRGERADAPRFRRDDPLLLEDELAEEERMMRDAARAFCTERLEPRVRAGRAPTGLQAFF